MFIKKLRGSRTALVGVCCALTGAAVVPVVGLATISGSTGDGPMVVQSGETTATYTSLYNIASLPTSPFKQLWQRVGDTVSVSGAFPVSSASAGASGYSAQVYIPLPVDSAFGSHDCVGNASINSTTTSAGRIFTGTAAGHTHQCVVEWATTTTTEQWVHYTLHYRVRD